MAGLAQAFAVAVPPVIHGSSAGSDPYSPRRSDKEGIARDWKFSPNGKTLFTDDLTRQEIVKYQPWIDEISGAQANGSSVAPLRADYGTGFQPHVMKPDINNASSMFIPVPESTKNMRQAAEFTLASFQQLGVFGKNTREKALARKVGEWLADEAGGDKYPYIGAPTANADLATWAAKSAAQILAKVSSRGGPKTPEENQAVDDVEAFIDNAVLAGSLGGEILARDNARLGGPAVPAVPDNYFPKAEDRASFQFRIWGGIDDGTFGAKESTEYRLAQKLGTLVEAEGPFIHRDAYAEQMGWLSQLEQSAYARAAGKSVDESSLAKLEASMDRALPGPSQKA